MIFTPDYLMICALCLAAVVLVITKVVRETSTTSNSNDDDGGIPQWDDSFPLPDLPNGVVTMDEYEEEQSRRLEAA
ncbi:MAG: hypothetical protein AAFO82_01130 [Bacteroidota bacterium]